MTSPFPQINSPPQDEAEVIVNEALETLQHAAVYGKDHSTTTTPGLTWGYYGGRWGGFSVAAGTFTLSNGATNYIVVAKATGVTTCSTSATNWNDTTNYVRVYKLTTAGGVVTVEEDHRAGPGGASSVAPTTTPTNQSIGFACSDETSVLGTGTSLITFHMPFDFTLAGDKVMAELATVQASGSIFTVDVNEAGVSILSTKLTIDNGEETSFTAATPPVVSDSSLAKGAKITVDIDQVGTAGAKGLKVWLIGYPT